MYQLSCACGRKVLSLIGSWLRIRAINFDSATGTLRPNSRSGLFATIAIKTLCTYSLMSLLKLSRVQQYHNSQPCVNISVGDRFDFATDHRLHIYSIVPGCERTH